MTCCVLDVSAALSMVAVDESSDATRRLSDRITEAGAPVPRLDRPPQHRRKILPVVRAGHDLPRTTCIVRRSMIALLSGERKWKYGGM